MEHAGQFSDALPLLEAALADLAPGQIICDERVNLMDLMSAVEVRSVPPDISHAALISMDSRRSWTRGPTRSSR